MKLRRVGAVAIIGLLAGVTGTAGSASAADTPETYVGSAAGRALNVSIPAVDVAATLGGSTASANSTLKASAEGVAYVTPLATNSVSSIADSATPTPADGQVCETPSLPAAAASILNVGLACATSSATVANGLPSALSSGSVAQLDLNANTALASLPIGDTLDAVFEPLIGNVEQLDPALTTVKDLVTSVLKTKTLEVKLGSSTSKVVTEAGTVTSEATAAGGEIKILPTPTLTAAPELSNIPVATITVTSSAAKAVYDRAAGVTGDPTFDAALVRVKLSPALGLPVTEFELAPGKTETILNDTPLESTITVANGSIVTNPDGTKGAVADGVKLHLLKGINESTLGARDGGIVLELAHSEAGVLGAAATRVLETPQIDLPRGELPRTGGFPVLPFMGGLVLGAGIVARRMVANAR